MKKIFVLLFTVALLAFVGCSKAAFQTNPDPSADGVKVENAIDTPTVQATMSAADVYVVQDTSEQPPGEADKTFWQLIADNWGSLLFALLGFVELLVRLTPSDKDNSIFNMLYKLLNAVIPNLKKGGGTYAVKTG